MGGARAQGVSRARITVLARLMETQTCLPSAPAKGGLSKGTVPPASTSLWEKAPRKPDNSVPGAFSAAAPELELGGIESKSLRGPFKSNARDSRSPLSHLVTISTGFHSPKFWGLLFLTLEPQAGFPGFLVPPDF